MARGKINDWNLKIDRTKTVIREGLNGVLYEYIIPINGNPYEYYNDAIDVRSHKKPGSKWNNGKKSGQYQPIGNKSHFTFYQLRQMRGR